MIKTSGSYNDIYNYRNSKYFINAVIEARRASNPNKDIVIFAGACQSFFEAIMESRCEFCIISCKGINRLHGSTCCRRKGRNNKSK